MEYKIDMGIGITVCIMTAVVMILVQSKRRREKQLLLGGTYIVRALPLYTGIMLFGIVFWLLIMWGMILLGEPDMVCVLVFLVLILFCLAGCFVFAFWGIVVNEDRGKLEYYRPPLKPVRVNISDITRVQFLENRLNTTERYRIRVFQGCRKLFDASDEMLNFDLLAQYLSENEAGAAEPDLYKQYYDGEYTIEQGYFRQGWIETAEQTDDFSVMASLPEKVRNGVPILIFLVIDILLVWNWKEWSRGEPYYFWYAACLTLFILLGLSIFISQMLRKISVCNHKIRVRNAFGRMHVYDAGEIVGVKRKEHYLILYAGGKRIAKVSKDDVNFASFEEWLSRELEQTYQSAQNEEE
ncbi:MAG: hypothetical protein K2O34_04905 [Acetatifactor sp.]|nr:hypothetical protein [Acetatifactor sp.]